MKTSEFARAFGVSEITVKRLVRQGILKPTREKSFIFSDADVEAMHDYLSPPAGMLDRGDIAVYLGVSLPTVNKWAESGRLTVDAVKKGKHYYKVEQLENLK